MGPSKKRKLRREERKAAPVDLPPPPTKHDEEDEEQVDYEASEEFHQHQPQQQQPQQHQELNEYEDPDEDPDAEDGGGHHEDNTDDNGVEEEDDDEGDGEGARDGDGDRDEDEEDDEEGEEEDIGKLLEPLSKEQLISLLRAAAASNPHTLAEIRRTADEDPALRRIFVHGISYATNADTLRSFFAQFGDVEECRIITDRVTGKSKGYGFIVFRHARAARRALKEPQKFIDGRMTACQMATVGPAAPPAPAPPPATAAHPQSAPYHTPQDVLPRKIFVGNVNPDVNKDRLVQFFSQFGEIEEGPLGFDRQTGKAKGYALFIYKTVEGAKRALQEPNKNFDGRLLYCQKATDSQRVKAAAAAVAGAAATPGPVTPDVQGNMAYNVPPMPFPGPMEMGFAQGFLGAALPFAQGMQANPAALAMLAAAGQNPAAFGVTPAMIASLNPALAAAAMNQGGTPVVQNAPVPQVQGYNMGGSAGYQNVGYQGPPPQQGGGPYQGPPMAPAMRPSAGPMGGYGPH